MNWVRPTPAGLVSLARPGALFHTLRQTRQHSITPLPHWGEHSPHTASLLPPTQPVRRHMRSRRRCVLFRCRWMGLGTTSRRARCSSGARRTTPCGPSSARSRASRRPSHCRCLTALSPTPMRSTSSSPSNRSLRPVLKRRSVAAQPAGFTWPQWLSYGPSGFHVAPVAFMWPYKPSLPLRCLWSHRRGNVVAVHKDPVCFVVPALLFRVSLSSGWGSECCPFTGSGNVVKAQVCRSCHFGDSYVLQPVTCVNWCP